MIRCPFSLEKMRYAPDSGMVVYRSKPHATLKRNYQLMPAIKWLRLLMNHIPDKYEHLVRYYGYYSNRSRGARRLIENGDDTAGSIRIDDTPANTRRKASWARLNDNRAADYASQFTTCYVMLFSLGLRSLAVISRPSTGTLFSTRNSTCAMLATS